MEKINDGAPAFQNHPDMPIDALGSCMTLRDYLAAKAMSAMICGIASAGYKKIPHKYITDASYGVADAMIAARYKANDA